MGAGNSEDVFSPAAFSVAEGVSEHSVVDVLNGLGDCPRILRPDPQLCQKPLIYDIIGVEQGV